MANGSGNSFPVPREEPMEPVHKSDVEVCRELLSVVYQQLRSSERAKMKGESTMKSAMQLVSNFMEKNKMLEELQARCTRQEKELQELKGDQSSNVNETSEAR
ncbi:hypothetical protein FNV43_RR16495 [Rhamnella rubrinervis]|uniref:Uncharacterized protein n=1 Tax=Rhamnella rubrinervis TaxID=2594499 RepID=A0A8K0MC31_9ROSA|nr:hypothetical protein FNV43_RR16495 [Rhamnella rubrinervis]